MHAKRRKNLQKQAKGFMWGRKSKVTLMKVAVIKSGVNAYRGRKLKKRDMRALFTTRINAAARENGTKYSTLIADMKKAGVTLNRKVLSEIAAKHPEAFKAVVAAVKK
jgi:large subunit ribosomal protein L20